MFGTKRTPPKSVPGLEQSTDEPDLATLKVGGNANVTVRPGKRQAPNSPVRDNSTYTQLTPLLVSEIVQDVVAKEINGMMTRLTKTITDVINKELKYIKQEIGEVKESMQFMSGQFDDIVKEQEVTRRELRNLKSENSLLKATVYGLATRVNYLEQKARASNLEIQCIPEKNKENLLHIVSNLGKAVNCPVQEGDILNCTRIAKINRDSKRPRSVVVQLSTPKLRDRFLAACLNYNRSNPKNKINTNHLGFSDESSPVFVCEHLPSSIKALHAAARIKAKEKGYKFVWVKNGRIFMKRDESAEYVFIKDQDSLEHIM